MKEMKKLFCILLICAFAGSLCGCVNERSMRKSPYYYHGSTWESEDGKVQFSIPENGDSEFTGIYKNGDVSVEMFFKYVTYTGLTGCTMEDYNALEPDEHGIKHIGGGHTPSFESYKLYDNHADDGWFVAQIVKSDIYEVGEEIKFYRVDNAD